MTIEDEVPPASVSSVRASVPLNLHVVSTQDEAGKRRRNVRWYADHARGAERLPPLTDLEDISGTWLDLLSWSRHAVKGAEPTYSVAPQLSNAITILIHDPRWKGIVAYDSFAETMVTRSAPPWHETDARGATVGDWTEDDTTRLESWYQRAYGLKIPDGKCLAAVSVVARATMFHPVRAYLGDLVWDGAPRISTWLPSLMGAADTPYTRTIGRAWLISAVARVMRPGCQVDTILILEGLQGTRKSSALRTLTGDAWFTEIAGEIDPVATPQLLRRKWVCEFAELSAMKKTRLQETIKGFLSRREDNYRPPYGRRARDFPRQSVFAGSTNDERYLTDPTGLRRFWPCACGNIYLRGIEIERDQLWAEAVHAFNDGEPWHLVDAGVVRFAQEEQGARYEEDVWADTVRQWIEPKANMGVTVEEILTSCLAIDTGRWSHADSSRVGAILRRLGWVASGKLRPRRYRPS